MSKPVDNYEKPLKIIMKYLFKRRYFIFLNKNCPFEDPVKAKQFATTPVLILQVIYLVSTLTEISSSKTRKDNKAVKC